MAIRFLKIREPYGFCSNFYPCDVPFGGLIYPTSEHAYQAQKFVRTSPKRAKQIHEAESPWEAAKLGRDRNVSIRSDWDGVRVQVMYSVVRAKFFHYGNRDIAEQLVGTGEQLLEEHFEDSFWGNAYGEGGKNWLGRVLMRVRDDLRGRWSEACLTHHFVEMATAPFGSAFVRRRVDSRELDKDDMPEDCIGFRFYDRLTSGCVDEDGTEMHLDSERTNFSPFYVVDPGCRYESPVTDVERETDIKDVISMSYTNVDRDDIVVLEAK